MTLLAWQRAGVDTGPAVVLIHGWGSSSERTWVPSGWVQGLAVAGCAVLVCDLPGHGASADVPIPAGQEPAGWTAQLLLADLRAMGVQTCAAVGHGDSGPVAGQLAVRDPATVRQLVLVSCDDRIIVPGAQGAAAALRDPRARVWNQDVADLLAAARHDPRNNPVVLADWVERRRWPAAPRLGALRTPVLLAVGTNDSHRERVPRLAQLFHDARVVTAPGDDGSVLASPQLVSQVAAFVRPAAPPESA